MLSYIDFLEKRVGVPVLLATVLIVVFFIMQVVGEFLEFKGKVVPEFLKIRKVFLRRRREKQEVQQTILDVKKLLAEVNKHYSEDQIARRNEWMQWVNDRAKVYDQSIVDIRANMTDVTAALNANTLMTEGMFIQSSRDRILDFATKVANEDAIVSREEFNRIMKVYNEYETFLTEHNKTNGEVDIAYRIIKEAYAVRLKNSSFIEDVRGYR